MALVSDALYRNPAELTRSPSGLKRIALIGSCMVGGWVHVLHLKEPGCRCDYLLWAPDIEVPARPPADPAEYDLLVVQIPLRGLIPDHSYFRMNHADTAAYEELLESAKRILSECLDATLAWNVEFGIPAFVCNALVPQMNPLGRFLPRDDLRNMVYFVEKLNEHLAHELRRFQNVYLFDVDSIVSTFGRKYIQDDMIWQINHGAMLVDADIQHDADRLEPVVSVHEHYPTKLMPVLDAIIDEMIVMFRTLRQVDAVKLVIFDIDDTLWRGIGAERGDGIAGEQAGWPTGIAEAIGYLKRRGILLAIVSKNTNEVVERIWPLHWHENVLSLSDFAVRKINWEPKATNIQAVLAETGLLARNTLFVDDNPVERDAVRQALPEIRVLGGSPYLWRRILLWSAETQVPTISTESSERTSMVQAQVRRDTERSAMSRQDWLASLHSKITFMRIADGKDPRFARAFELLNKTNQFNTTGKRWTLPEISGQMCRDFCLYAAVASDRHTNYGLIAVAVVRASTIVQFVMSCRVIGMEIELAMLSRIVEVMRGQGIGTVLAETVDTDLNLLSRDLFQRASFILDGAHWKLDASAKPTVPSHVAIDVVGLEELAAA